MSAPMRLMLAGMLVALAVIAGAALRSRMRVRRRGAWRRRQGYRRYQYPEGLVRTLWRRWRRPPTLTDQRRRGVAHTEGNGA